MYIQDEKQHIVANLDEDPKWDRTYQTSRMWTIMVVLPETGAFVKYQDKEYEILTTTTIQDESGIATICRILLLTDEGEDAGEEPISVKADELELI